MRPHPAAHPHYPLIRKYLSVYLYSKWLMNKKKYKLKRMDPLAELYITIQRISVRQSNQVIRWIVLSPFWTTGASTLLTDKASTTVSLFCFLSLKLINETVKNSLFNYSKNTMSLLFKTKCCSLNGFWTFQAVEYMTRPCYFIWLQNPYLYLTG